MVFIVNRNGDGADVKDAEFEPYLRLPLQRDIKLGKSPRVPEPRAHRRWLHVWTSEKDALSFVKELKKRTGDQAWTVAQVDAPLSEGLLGPLIVQIGRRASSLVLELHPLSRFMIQSAFPEAKPSAATISIYY